MKISSATVLARISLLIHFSISCEGFVVHTSARHEVRPACGSLLQPLARTVFFRQLDHMPWSLCRMSSRGRPGGAGKVGSGKGFGKPRPEKQEPPEDGDSQTTKAGQPISGKKDSVPNKNRTLLLQFKCNRCETTSQYMIGKAAYEEGIVVCTCQTCKARHLIADNLNKLDFPEFGRNIEEFMSNQTGEGQEVTKATLPDMSPELMKKFNLVLDDSGTFSLAPKKAQEP